MHIITIEYKIRIHLDVNMMCDVPIIIIKMIIKIDSNVQTLRYRLCSKYLKIKISRYLF